MSKKICVVGAGYWGRNHIKTLAKLGVLKGVVDLDNKLIESYVTDYPDVSYFEDIDIALKEDYDGFTIATPAETHFELAKKIIISGRHVLIEKPMTLSISDTEELLKLSEKYGVNIMVGHVLLFHPAIIKIKELVQNGSIGEMQYLYSNRLNLGKVRTEENVFWSLAPHDIAIFQYLTDSFPINIQAIGSTFLQEGIPDSTMTHLEYENGVEGHIFVSWLHPFKEHRLVVIGSEAMISFEDSSDGKPLKFYSKKFDLLSGVPEKIDGPVDLIPYEQKMPLTSEFEYFLEHLSNKKLEIANGEHGLEVMKILVKASEQILS
tara:strand:+ start:4589 stop:5548 length:960 start_codon:yes stop_codon:yes gene_type:complete